MADKKNKIDVVNKTLKNMKQQAETEAHILHNEPVVILKRAEFVKLLNLLIDMTEEYKDGRKI